MKKIGFKRVISLLVTTVLAVSLAACKPAQQTTSGKDPTTSTNRPVTPISSSSTPYSGVELTEPFTEFKMVSNGFNSSGVETYMVEIPGQTEALRLVSGLDKPEVVKAAVEAGLSAEKIYNLNNFDGEFPSYEKMNGKLQQSYDVNYYKTIPYVSALDGSLVLPVINARYFSQAAYLLLLSNDFEQSEIRDQLIKMSEYVEEKTRNLKIKPEHYNIEVTVDGDIYYVTDENKMEICGILVSSLKNPSGALTLLMANVPDVQVAIDNPESFSTVTQASNADIEAGVIIHPDKIFYRVILPGDNEIVLTDANVNSTIEALLSYPEVSDIINNVISFKERVFILGYHSNQIKGTNYPLEEVFENSSTSY